MTIYPLSGASWPAKQQSYGIDEGQALGRRPREMQMQYSSCRSSLRPWELRKVASLPVIDADYWSDASLSLPHLVSGLPAQADQETLTVTYLRRSQIIGETPIADQCARHTQRSSHVEEPTVIKSATRSSAHFPPPLEAPAVCEGKYHHLQSLDKVCFTSVRSNGRLLMTRTPITVQPRRHLHMERRDGRLLLRIYEESSSTEEHSEEEDEDSPITERAMPSNPFAPKAREGGVAAKKGSSAVGEEAEEGEAGGDRVVGKVSLFTKMLRTLDCDACSDAAHEAFSPLHLHVKQGRSSGVASFLHKSLTRVRPLNVLTIWQS